jgi:hypothetical protein
VFATDLDLNHTLDLDFGPAPLRKTRALSSENMSVLNNLFEEMVVHGLKMDNPVPSLSHRRISFIMHRHHLTPGDS